MKLITKINSPPLWIKKFPWKKYSGHKYSRGRVIMFGGKKELAGATILAAEAALRLGTGSVKIVCNKDNLLIYSLRFPSALKVKINTLNELRKFLKKEKITAILIGPGSGISKKTKQITELILKKIKYVVIDADALTSFHDDLYSFYNLLDENKIITPHLAEFHKIFPNIKKNINNFEKVIEALKLTKTNIVLKGPITIIGSHNKKIVINKHSSPELSVIGSGDVLSGLITSLISEKKMKPFMAGCAATWIHGDIARKHGKGLISEDIVKGIPAVLKRLKKWKNY